MNHLTSALKRVCAATVGCSVFSMFVLMLMSPQVTQAALLTQQLELGMRNSEVASLQSFLSTDAAIYPQGLVTSYFGFLTKAAVSNFQSRNGIDAVGRVGPVTLAAINMQMSGGVISDTTEGAGKVTRLGVPQPILSGVYVSGRTSNSMTIAWASNVPATARVMYSTTWPFSYRNALQVTSSASPSFAQSVTLNNLQQNTRYYFVAESLDAQGNFSWSSSGVFAQTN